MCQDVIHYIQSCLIYAHHNIQRHKAPGQMDFKGPLPRSGNGKRYVILLTDYLSKCVICEAVCDNSTKTAAEFLVYVSLEFGPPHQLQTEMCTYSINTLSSSIERSN